jgi:hypothetical protein
MVPLFAVRYLRRLSATHWIIPAMPQISTIQIT